MPGLLMLLSMLSLLILQGLWLRAEYHSAADSFSRETNLLYRATVQQMHDSLSFRFFRLLSEEKDDAGDSLRSEASIRTIAIHRGGSRSNDAKQDTVQIHPDSLNLEGTVHIPWRGSPWELMRTLPDVLHFHADTLSRQFEQALLASGIPLPFEIISKEIPWEIGSQRPNLEPPKPPPFITSYMPVYHAFYAARFEEVRPWLFRQIFPQIGFSAFTTLVIFLSFVLIYRSLHIKQRLIEQKNDLIGNITHELMTPVATAGVALEAIRRFDVMQDAEKTREYLDMASHELNRLGMITEKILRASLLDQERENNILPRRELDLKKLVEQVTDSFRQPAKQKQVEIHLKHEGDTLIKGQEEPLSLMIYHLIDNALKYAAGGQEIKLKIQGIHDAVVIQVEDKGPGIPEQHQSKIYEKFYRVPAGNIHTVKGHGLGLYFVKKVVEGHGGRIHLESKSGQGSLFTIKLPRHG